MSTSPVSHRWRGSLRFGCPVIEGVAGRVKALSSSDVIDGILWLRPVAVVRIDIDCTDTSGSVDEVASIEGASQ